MANITNLNGKNKLSIINKKHNTKIVKNDNQI